MTSFGYVVVQDLSGPGRFPSIGCWGLFGCGRSFFCSWSDVFCRHDYQRDDVTARRGDDRSDFEHDDNGGTAVNDHRSG